MTFSLAPLKYWDVFTDRNGPIEKVLVSPFSILGKPGFQANASLRPDLSVGKPSCAVYGNNDGTGSDPDPVIAQHMAISEALERWALISVQTSGEGKKYAFDIDPSSNGMAAFPGFAWQARRYARLEALERFALISWWNGHCPATLTEVTSNVGTVRIHHGTDLGEVAIAFRKSPNGSVAYGHAAAKSFSKAVGKAVVEMLRSEFVINRYRAANSTAAVSNYFERRALYFSTPDGHSEFLHKLSAHTTKKPAPWRTIFDGEVPGPWSKWATVWRHVVEMPSYEFLDRKVNCFFW